MKSDLTPILVFGFNRPTTLMRQFARLDKLERRDIWVAIDGPTNFSTPLQQECIEVATKWESQSHHKIQIHVQQNNLGLHRHFIKMFESFFNKFEIGIILEDDIEFRKEFINFVDSNQDILRSEGCWSISGHNPLVRRDLMNRDVNAAINFQKTNIHTIWGWATNRGQIAKFLEVTQVEYSWFQILLGIKQFAKNTSCDPALRSGIEATWLRKSIRAKGLDSGGWDNWWVVAGWISGWYSLQPNFSLCREAILQDEGQAHPHVKIGVDWPEFDQLIPLNISGNTININKNEEIEKLRIWGITRKYCWANILRIKKEFKKINQNLIGA